jgi:hypothetical protein
MKLGGTRRKAAGRARAAAPASGCPRARARVQSSSLVRDSRRRPAADAGWAGNRPRAAVVPPARAALHCQPARPAIVSPRVGTVSACSRKCLSILLRSSVPARRSSRRQSAAGSSQPPSSIDLPSEAQPARQSRKYTERKEVASRHRRQQKTLPSLRFIVARLTRPRRRPRADGESSRSSHSAGRARHSVSCPRPRRPPRHGRAPPSSASGP